MSAALLVVQDGPIYRLQKLVNPGKHTYKVEWIYGYDVTTS